MTSSAASPLHRALLAAAFSICTSSATLVCCALPALFIAAGAGAALAGLVTALPGLIWISAHKTAVFVTAGVTLVTAGVLRFRAARTSCPVDPKLHQACNLIRRASTVLYLCSVGIYILGGLFAFVLPGHM